MEKFVTLEGVAPPLKGSSIDACETKAKAKDARA
jgi:hypothetical protein